MSTVFDLTPEDAMERTALYRDYEWCADRDAETVREALAETEVAVGVESSGDLVAERGSSPTTRTTRTYSTSSEPRSGSDGLHESLALVNVIVAADRRGEGFGEELMEAVRDHPELRSVAGLSLLCREGLVPFYESVGFELVDPEMEIPEGGTEELVRMKYVID